MHILQLYNFFVSLLTFSTAEAGAARATLITQLNFFIVFLFAAHQ